jgi:hypothetical protein
VSAVRLPTLSGIVPLIFLVGTASLTLHNQRHIDQWG